jgi:predicted AAA+ superfamily ATPase
MQKDYQKRIVDSVLDDLLPEVAAISLVGPKAVGKTATAQRRVRTVIRLDDPLEREAFVNTKNPLTVLPGPLLLDEWQYLPEIWNNLRRAVDDGAPPGRFILAGSALPQGAAIHSGAGRIIPVRMRPYSLAERALADPTVSLADCLSGQTTDIGGSTDLSFVDYAQEITASGFPALRQLSAPVRTAQLTAYLDAIVNREFAEQGLSVRRPETLRRWLRAYAAAPGTTANYTAILNAATPGELQKPSAGTTIAYRDILSSLWMLDEVGPWDPAGTSISRVAQTPKHFLADPALSALLINLDERTLIAGPLEPSFGPTYGSIAGRLFEALVALSLQTYATSANARVSYLRTRSGDHKIDIIIQRGQQIVAIEVKLSPRVEAADGRHLIWFRDKLGPALSEAMIITTGPHAYRRVDDGILVVPAALLGP